MQGSPMVLFNVGGQLHTTTTATLQSPRAQDSMLERLVSLHVQQHSEEVSPAGSNPTTVMPAALTDPNHPRSIFIDRDGSVFGYILNYLRDGDLLVLPDDLHTTRRLLREAEFYQLQGLEALLTQHAAQLEQAAQESRQHLSDLSIMFSKLSPLVELVRDMSESTHSMSATVANTATKLLKQTGNALETLGSIDDELMSLKRVLKK